MLSDDEILERLVALNAERAARGSGWPLIRWLRPEFQNPALKGDKQQALSLIDDGAEDNQPAAKAGKKSRGGERKDACRGRQARLAQRPHYAGQSRSGRPLRMRRSGGGSRTGPALLPRPRETIDEILQALVTRGQARRTRGGRYTC